MIKIIQFLNSPITSNSYLLHAHDSASCTIIDPGTFDNVNDLNIYVRDNNLTIEQVVLTHEHFDHITGLISLLEHYDFEILCSEYTAEALIDPKKNLSAFNDQMKPIIINKKPNILNDNEERTLLGKRFHFFLTPGHSPGSLCFVHDSYFFSGDTVLNHQKTRLNLPGSNKEEYKLSVEKIKKHLKSGMIIYPGHGDSFMYKEAF